MMCFSRVMCCDDARVEQDSQVRHQPGILHHIHQIEDVSLTMISASHECRHYRNSELTKWK